MTQRKSALEMKQEGLSEIVRRLRVSHEEPPPTLATTDPFELILYENVAYLVDDAHRLEAFENLRKTIGTRPEDILTADAKKFESVVKLAGSDKKGRVAKLVRSAEIAMNEFDSDLRGSLVFRSRKRLLP